MKERKKAEWHKKLRTFGNLHGTFKTLCFEKCSHLDEHKTKINSIET